jgi:predicted ATPase/transcriptional regulator with XRE-family HTH domain
LLGTLLRQHREARGWLQEELAARVVPPLSVNTIGNLERGRTRPHRRTLETLVASFGLDAEQTAELMAAWHTYGIPADSRLPAPQPLHAPSIWPGHNLPPPTTRLIGREHELGVITTQLQSPAVQLLTLTGAGGIGKSRLALAAAATLVDDFADGAWFVRLAPVANPSQVVVAIAEAVGLPDAGGQLRDNLREFLQRRHLLLVLDNFEHLLQAVTLVADLIAEAPGLKVLVTSREALHLSSEHTLEVPPLRLAPPNIPEGPAHPAADIHTFAPIQRSDAVRLFVDCVRAVDSDFALNSTNAVTIADICRQLDGLPLAIELAAARVKHVGLNQLRRLLQRRLSLLIGGAADLPPRQQTLRGAIAWSYDLLDTEEQAVFRRLSVFVGGCTLEAAVAVCGHSSQSSDQRGVVATIDVVNRVSSLIDKSLLRLYAGANDEPRYSMLETVREFGLEQLDAAGEDALTRELHATYYHDFARQAAPHFLATDQLEWLARVDDEFGNLRTCLAWLLESNQFERGQYLAGGLWYFWSAHSRVTEGREWLARFLDDPRGGSTPAHARVWAYLALSWITVKQDDIVANYAASTSCLALARSANDRWLLGIALARVAFAAERMDTRSIAAPRDRSHPLVSTAVAVVELYDEAIEIFRSLHDDWATAQCLVYFARFLSSRDVERARGLVLEALDLARPIGERNTVGMALGTLANLTLDAHDSSTARRLVEESLRLAEELNDVFNASQRLGTLAQIAMDDMRFVDAVDLLERCATSLRFLGNQHRLAHTQHELAVAARMGGYSDRAVEAFQECRALFEHLGLHAEAAAVMASLGHVQRRQGERAVALSTFEASWRLLDARDVELGIPTVLAGLGGLALDTNRPSQAACLLGAAEALIERLQAGPEGMLNTTRPSLRGYQLRRDAAHVRELRAECQRAFSHLPLPAFASALKTGRALTTVYACRFGLESVSAPTRSEVKIQPT